MKSKVLLGALSCGLLINFLYAGLLLFIPSLAFAMEVEPDPVYASHFLLKRRAALEFRDTLSDALSPSAKAELDKYINEKWADSNIKTYQEKKLKKAEAVYETAKKESKFLGITGTGISALSLAGYLGLREFHERFLDRGYLSAFWCGLGLSAWALYRYCSLSKPTPESVKQKLAGRLEEKILAHKFGKYVTARQGSWFSNGRSDQEPAESTVCDYCRWHSTNAAETCTHDLSCLSRINGPSNPPRASKKLKAWINSPKS